MKKALAVLSQKSFSSGKLQKFFLILCELKRIPEALSWNDFATLENAVGRRLAENCGGLFFSERI